METTIENILGAVAAACMCVLAVLAILVALHLYHRAVDRNADRRDRERLDTAWPDDDLL